MKRRQFVGNSVAAVASLGISAHSGKLHAAEFIEKKRLIVCFHAGSFEKRAADGSWHIVILADPRVTKGPQRIRLNFEVALDDKFETIVAKERHFALKSNSYIVRVHFFPPEGARTLFYRFVAADVKRDSPRGIFAPQPVSSPTKQLGFQA